MTKKLARETYTLRSERINITSSKLIIFKKIIFMLWILSATLANAEQKNSITISQGQSTSDYFGDDASNLSSLSTSLLYSRSLTSALSVSGSYYATDGKDKWLPIGRENLSAFNQASVEAKGYGLSATWDKQSYSFNLGYIDSKNTEQSLTFLPRVIESLKSHSQVINFSVDSSVELAADSSFNQWNFDWSIGFQQANFDAQIADVIGLDSAILVTSNIQLKQLSSFTNLELNYWYQKEHYVITPFLSLNWNLEISTSGQQTVLLSRGGDARPVDLLDGRFTSDVHIPDSGQWDLGVGILFDTGWSADLTYSQSISTSFPIKNINFSVSVFF